MAGHGGPDPRQLEPQGPIEQRGHAVKPRREEATGGLARALLHEPEPGQVTQRAQLEGHRSGRMWGKRITSRMDCEFVSTMASRSMPTPQPPVGGRPWPSART